MNNGVPYNGVVYELEPSEEIDKRVKSIIIEGTPFAPIFREWKHHKFYWWMHLLHSFLLITPHERDNTVRKNSEVCIGCCITFGIVE